MKTTAIILAGGSGTRLSSRKRKQYLSISGKPMLVYSLEQFDQSDYIDEILLVLPEDEIDYCKNKILQGYTFRKLQRFVPGGKERYDSVMHSLACAEGSTYVFIHDAARPFIDEDMIKFSYKAAVKYGACALGVPATDTIKKTDRSQMVTETLERDCLWHIQTPQVFLYDAIREAYEKFDAAGRPFVTDDSMVMERFGSLRVKMVMGSYENIKITTLMDLYTAENILQKRE